jgi:pyrroline-5-carboxylate reductase
MKIGFLGCGQMAQALARGFMSAGGVQAQEITGSDIDAGTGQRWREELGVGWASSNGEVLGWADVIFLAVKPQSMAPLMKEIAGAGSSKPLFVSIAAGISMKQLQVGLGSDRRVIRVMPNTPCLVGAGAIGWAAGEHATAKDVELVQTLLSSVGLAYQVPEKLLDAVTGLSGSGPAYVYLMIEALSDGGVKAGLSREMAMQLAAQTVLGAAKMVLDTKLHPGVLKDRVTSPAGTTIAGLAVLEQRGVRSAFLDAVVAATERSRELGS